MRKWSNDPFTKKARDENFLARSIYKLEEIDKKEKFLKQAKVIVDLGAAPGSWTQLCLKLAPEAKIYSIDIEPLKVSDSRVTFLHQSISDVESFPVSQADVVLSDMAPKTTGMRDADEANSLELATLALQAAEKILKPNGVFVVKVFMGGDFDTYKEEVRKKLGPISIYRPESTRKHSRETFLFARRSSS